MQKTGCVLFLACLIVGVRADGEALPPQISSTAPPPPLPRPSLPPSPSPSASPSPNLLYFNEGVPQLTTCESADFKWNYTASSPATFILSIVTDQEDSSTTSPINEVVKGNVDATLNTYTWPSVNVPQGWYQLYAMFPTKNLTFPSPKFRVQSGTNISCLSGSTASQSGTNANHTAVIGGVLGGAALMLGVAIIFLFSRRKRSHRTSAPAPAYSDDGKRGRGFVFSAGKKSWDNLGSVDSHVGAVIPPARRDSKRLRYQQRHPASQISFADSVNLPVLEYNRSRKSLNGDEKYSPGSSVLSKSPLHDAMPFEASQVPRSPRRRLPSDTSSLAASTALSHVPGLAPPEPRSVTSSQVSSPIVQSKELLSMADAPDLTTTISSPKTRKSARKPVPSYDHAADITPSPPTSPPSDEIGFSPLRNSDPFARPMPAVIRKSSAASLDALSLPGFGSSGNGHYVARSQSQTGINRGLAHKQSLGFEGRPMHYLIPDMPLPQEK